MSDSPVQSATATESTAVLTVTNNHFPGCGVPPALKNAFRRYTAYFETHHGDQCVMQYDPDARTAQLWMGDVGWQEPLQVVEFRGEWAVLFVRTPAERRADERMNEQFQHGGTAAPDPDKWRAAVWSALRKMYGKPRLTDAECERLANAPILNQHEQRVIDALWRMWAG